MTPPGKTTLKKPNLMVKSWLSLKSFASIFVGHNLSNSRLRKILFYVIYIIKWWISIQVNFKMNWNLNMNLPDSFLYKSLNLLNLENQLLANAAGEI